MTKEIKYEDLIGTFEQKQAIVKDFNLMDDGFFSEVMKDKSACEYILREITGIYDLKVMNVKTQYSIRNLNTHSVTLDVLAEDSKSKIYNIEVQKPNNDYHPKRIRYYQSNIDISYLEKGVKYKNLPDIYLIYITAFDIFKLNDNYYSIKRTVNGYDKEVPNGIHEIYLNTAVKTNRPITPLMEYFKNTDMNISHFGALSDRIKQIKHTEEGVNAMSDAVRNFAKKYAADINADLTLQLKETEEKMKKEKQILESEKQVLETQKQSAIEKSEKLIKKMREMGMSDEQIKEITDN
ncbi:MAG: Rpn family recombination-promoting nuclease/putative transposase [Oscillospiraceae bacterium]|nr:Rpn family recombination-promoting nuclease/putative transposase [Oscillospiraceae bacterium]